MYKCEDCRKTFEYADTVKERHGLPEPPYEIIYVCPYCKSTAFSEYSPNIEKFDVAGKLLEGISDLHIFEKNLKKLLGENIKNENFDDALGVLSEFIIEMFPDISLETTKLIYSVTSDEEIDKILEGLEG